MINYDVECIYIDLLRNHLLYRVKEGMFECKHPERDWCRNGDQYLYTFEIKYCIDRG